ncbi:ferredoxin [Streptomyces sp. H39-S7]|uniref:ferredoxin n=1 Tax=Streptomyces sp. H39-S7 TaxID=3004357 RepID=UPI0022AF383A|nr:ferredoxin [Streptomyces sp. H39-S7]MCZ4125221.1 ferredoxin [Streptomyces sp. H39-S7]
MNIALAPERCVGAGQCVLSAPDVFDQDPEDGVVVLLHASPPSASHTAVYEAADLCPARAIAVTGDVDGQGHRAP